MYLVEVRNSTRPPLLLLLSLGEGGGQVKSSQVTV